VHTAIVLAWRNRLYEDVSITSVIIRPLTADEIDWYVRSGEGIGKAGAYGIQGLASAFVESISGSYSGVMGLPLFETCRLLARAYSASD
jgi:septum formation protein